jgi:hypothetical protein
MQYCVCVCARFLHVYANGVQRAVHSTTYLNIRVFNNMRVSRVCVRARCSYSIAVMRHALALQRSRDLSLARGDDVTSSGSPPTPLRPQ